MTTLLFGSDLLLVSGLGGKSVNLCTYSFPWGKIKMAFLKRWFVMQLWMLVVNREWIRKMEHLAWFCDFVILWFSANVFFFTDSFLLAKVGCANISEKRKQFPLLQKYPFPECGKPLSQFWVVKLSVLLAWTHLTPPSKYQGLKVMDVFFLVQKVVWCASTVSAIQLSKSYSFLTCNLFVNQLDLMPRCKCDQGGGTIPAQIIPR